MTRTTQSRIYGAQNEAQNEAQDEAQDEAPEAKIDRVEARACRLPTEHGPESDGTAVWDSTTMVITQVHAAGVTGTGYSYIDAAAAGVIRDLLAPALAGIEACSIPAATMAMLRAIRNHGRPGLVACAISAVDVALWDLKARLFGVPLATLLGPARASVPAYASGGFTSTNLDQLARELAGYVAAGHRAVKIKIGRAPAGDVDRVRVAREAIGRGVELMVDANGAYARKQALAMAERFAEHDVVYFEEPVSADDLDGLRLVRDRAPGGMAIAAGEYGYDGWYFRRMLEAGAVDILQADATRAIGITGFLQAKLQVLADMREQALGVDAFEPGKPDNYEGWEDSAVPPERLAAYLRELHALYAQHGLSGSLYGHFAQGCVHTRIDFGLDKPAGVARYRAFTEDAAHLVVAHGGSLSGEHGDGQSRADLHAIMFGPELVEAFDEFKTIWDPDRAMNPGKMVAPSPRTSHLRLLDYHPAPGPIELAHGDDGKDFAHAAVRCVGIGKCRKRDAGTMCPSYMVTLDERHSTRGRAHLLFEMMRGDVLTDGWRSDAVRESLELCLACKACKRECPTHVDMASYKAEFMAHHYEGRLRPREAYTFGWLDRWLGLGRPLAPLANFLTHARGLRVLVKRLAGIAPEREVPRIARRSFRRMFRAPAAARGARRVLLWPDTFNDAFYPSVLHDAVRVLGCAGFAVEIPRPRLCCGRPLYEYGWLDEARRFWDRTLDALADDIDGDIPLVGLEPSCVAAFRDELPALFPGNPRAERLSRQTHTLGEFLVSAGFQPPRVPAQHILYHRHCHHAAILAPEHDIALLRAAGHAVEVLDSGCCGMAGAFGFQRTKYEHSVALAERVLLPAIRANPSATIVADGFSCREQLRQLGHVRARHLAELLTDLPVLA